MVFSEIINDKEYFKEDVSFMRRKRMMITGIISIALGISLVGCGGGKEKNTREPETEQVTEETSVDEGADDISADDGNDTVWEDTTEENGSEESTEFSIPVQEDFTLAPGLSEKYADIENRSFVYNGQKFTLGESTLKDLIDGGIPFEENDLNNSGNNVNKNYETERYTARINDYVTMQFMFGNFTDSEQKAEDCILSYVRYSHLYDPQPDYDADMNSEIAEAMLDAAKIVNFSFPGTLTKDQLLANSSENAEEDGNYVKYMVDSEVYMGRSGYEFEFNKETYQLKEVIISWLP